MFSNITMFLFFFIFISLINANKPASTTNVCKCAFISLLLWLCLINVLTSEYFTFEVSPHKKYCRRCNIGYNGQPIQFEYTGDKERANARAQGCQIQDPNLLLKNNPNSYQTFRQSEEQFRKGDHKTLGDIWKSVENYTGCSSCAAPVVEGYGCGSAPVVEGYGCGSAAPVVEGYGCGSAAPVVEGYGCGSAAPVVEGYGCGSAAPVVEGYGCGSAAPVVEGYSCGSAAPVVEGYGCGSAAPVVEEGYCNACSL